MGSEKPTRVLLLGASGLIGRFVTDDLRARGFHVVGIARKFSASQRINAFDLEMPVLEMDASISFPATKAILTSHGFPPAIAVPFAAITSLMDMSIGVLIAFRRTCAAGLVAGIVLSLGYMAGTALLTPDLWIEPLGALVKTGPAIVLMLVALLTLDNR
jgi:NAD(P)-dependent dehydrogenase (short-subunit alcohol dehydrogenase family)